MANAIWWVRYVDKNWPYDYTQTLSLSSPDLRDTREAKRRAKSAAIERLRRKGVNPRIVSVDCVG